jgi:CheY-like chemotaxis protein
MPSRNVRLEQQRVLLVDDNHFGNTARKVLLEQIGLQVETALSGEEGWEKFRSAPFDLVITDYRMTGMTGADLIKRIRESGRPARTILLTGCTFLGLTEESTGADMVLSKCHQEPELLTRTARQLLCRPRRKSAASETPRAERVATSG